MIYPRNSSGVDSYLVLMKYIVFDLEWNQPEDGKSSAERELLFEIIEIGAVKLNEKKEIVSKFQTLIKPQVYDQINWRIRKMLDLKPGELNRGKSFPDAAKAFLEWSGKDAVFCTWGGQDLTELQRNMAYYGMEQLSDHPIRYLNVQKLYSAQTGDWSQMALANAIEKERIVKDVPFHRAYSDAYYTTKILRLIRPEIELEYAAYDLYHLPASREEELLIRENGRKLIISNAYADTKEMLEDPHLTTLRCEACNGRSVRQSIKWYNNGNYWHAAGSCPEHGYLASKIRVKKAERGGVYAERCVYEVSENEYKRMQVDRDNYLARQRRLARKCEK